MKIKAIILLIFLTSCSSFGEAGKALRNEKIRSTDEFLIEKRGPLTVPPNLDELPRPKSSQKTDNINKNILGTNSKSGVKSDENSKLEKILLEEIRNN
tara:strand:- start:889 stop:1182 length:294 start_codon:yes stop_codon:yes gene_type:complete